MKHMLLMILAVCSLQAFSKDKEISVKTNIESVLVFQQGAQVERTGKASIPTGSSLLIFTGLSNNIDASQIRFNGKGDFTVLSSYHYYKTDTIAGWETADIRTELQRESQLIYEEIQRENGWLAIYDREETMLQQNQLFGSKEEGIAIAKLKEAAEFVRERYIDIRTQRLAIQDRVAELNSQINEINLKLGALRNIETKTQMFYAVRVNAKKPTTANVSLTYQVNGAGWRPGYDARVTSVNEPLSLIQNAFVFQTSGEEWDNVSLAISTGKPHQAHNKPYLSPWYLSEAAPIYRPHQGSIGSVNSDMNNYLRNQGFNANVRNVSGRILDEFGNPMVGAQVVVPGYGTGAVTDVNGFYNVSVPPGASTLQYSYIGHGSEVFNVSSANMNVYLGSAGITLDEVQVQSKQSNSLYYRDDEAMEDANFDMNYALVAVAYTPTQTEFTIDAKYNIPSDGTQYAVQVQKIELPADFIYQCTPKLDPLAYLTARITDWEDFNLYDGPMNIYFEDSYVGKANLNLQNVEDTLALSLGPDQRIEVRRKRVKADQKKQLIAGTRKDIREWHYIVKNNKRESIRIQIDDHVPVSTTEEIEIEITDLDGGRHSESTGFILWDLELSSGKTKDFRLKYNVRYPKDMRLSYR